MTIVEAARGVTGGVDTHPDVDVGAALDPLGGLLGTERFETNSAGDKALLAWLESFGSVTKVSVEGTGSYGSGRARFLKRVGVEVRRSAVQRAAGRSRETVPSKPSGSSSSPSAQPARPGSRP